MKINKVHFLNGLDNKLEDIYSFFADESIQITELTDEVIKRAKTKGFEEKQTFIITKDTDWTFLNSTNENLDLFGSKKIIEIKLIGSGPGNKGSKVIKDYCLAPDSNKLLIISAEKLDKKQQSSAWAKALDENGIIVVEPPVSKASMPEWIRAKSSDLKLKLANQAIELLSDKTEGNLFAASQELMKLSLLFPDQEISLGDMEKSISNSSKFGIFDLSNSFLRGNKQRTVKIIETLRAEGTQPPLVLWALSKEINNLYKVLEDGNTKNIWGPRYYLDLLSKRAKEIPNSKIKNSFKDIAEIDASIKGLSDKSPWQSIRKLALDF
jgi:DNA polymerase-3 subunit delta